MIGVNLSTQEEQAVIEVWDNGPGIPAEMRTAVFERFRQLEGHAARRHGGTGLGLSIVKEFVELHGGNVACTEATGGSACFTVTLPLRAPQGSVIDGSAAAVDATLVPQAMDELRLEHAAAARVSIMPLTGPETAPLILVVEDNPDMNAYVVDALKTGYRVAAAFDGEERLAKALEICPDLIISDVMMPKMRTA